MDFTNLRNIFGKKNFCCKYRTYERVVVKDFLTFRTDGKFLEEYKRMNGYG